jgi:hypothetical protein
VKTTSWTSTAVLAIACWVALPGEGRAQARCPWLNAATAAGVLGGEVQMSVTAPVDPGASKVKGVAMYPDQVRVDRFDVPCDFRRKVDSSVYKLSIVVRTMRDSEKDFASVLALCTGSTSPLRGIGNEAAQCVWKDNSHADDEQIIARVRDRAFVLMLHRDATAMAGASKDGLRDDTRNVAEQIAGSLF